MNIGRIKGIILQEYFITQRSLEIIIDLFYFSIISIVVFGFVSVFFVGQVSETSAFYLLLGLLLWEIIRVAQYSMSVGALWNIWSKNLSNMFITPLTVPEYFTAHMIAGTIKALLTFTLVSVVSVFLFKFNILDVGIQNLVLFIINLLIFSFSIGIIIVGMVFRWGNRIQALAWGLIFIFQPLTAVVYPLSVLPETFQKIALLFPPTYVFEAARAALTDTTINWPYFFIALFENIFYFAVSVWIFAFLFKKSRETGQFTRNET